MKLITEHKLRVLFQKCYNEGWFRALETGGEPDEDKEKLFIDNRIKEAEVPDKIGDRK